MRKLIVGLMFFTMAFSGGAQHKADMGIFGGAAYYLGDINPNQQFYAASFAIGGVYRYNFNSRYALRASMLFSHLKANDLDFPNRYQAERRAYFATEVVDLALQLEFNFQSFWVPRKSHTKGVVPFLVGGVGFLAPTSTVSSVTLPIGVGVKFNLPGRLSGSLEWSFRKSFTDGLDYLDDPNQFGENSIVHNNDWASFAGIVISYKLFPDNEECHSFGRYVK